MSKTVFKLISAAIIAGQANASFFGLFGDTPEEVVKPATIKLVHTGTQ